MFGLLTVYMQMLRIKLKVLDNSYGHGTGMWVCSLQFAVWSKTAFPVQVSLKSSVDSEGIDGIAFMYIWFYFSLKEVLSE